VTEWKKERKIRDIQKERKVGWKRLEGVTFSIVLLGPGRPRAEAK
jgi:hypothetical protein